MTTRWEEPEYLGDGFYCSPRADNIPVSKDGRVKYQNGEISSGKLSDMGYLIYTKSYGNKKKRFRIHRLIMLTFCKPEPGKPDVNHINGVKTDNRLENLEWTNKKENARHAVENGLLKFMKPVDMKNLETGKVYSFRSITEASAFLGVNNSGIVTYLKSPRDKPYQVKWVIVYAGERWPNLQVVDTHIKNSYREIVAQRVDEPSIIEVWHGCTPWAEAHGKHPRTVNARIRVAGRLKDNVVDGWALFYLNEFIEKFPQYKDVVTEAERLGEKRKPKHKKHPSFSYRKTKPIITYDRDKKIMRRFESLKEFAKAMKRHPRTLAFHFYGKGKEKKRWKNFDIFYEEEIIHC